MIHILYRTPTGGSMTGLPLDQLTAALQDKRSLIWVDLDGEDPGTY